MWGVESTVNLQCVSKMVESRPKQGWKLSGRCDTDICNKAGNSQAPRFSLTHEPLPDSSQFKQDMNYIFLAQKLGPFCQHFYCLLHMPWRRGPRTFCNRPEVVFNCNGVLAWVCHFQQAAFSSLAKRPGPCPVSVSTLQLLIAGCELPANLSPNIPLLRR